MAAALAVALFLTSSLWPSGSPEVATPANAPALAEGRPLTAAVRRTERSTVGVFAGGCGSGFSGSGFVVAPSLVLTAAHVVAGTMQPVVQSSGGAPVPAVAVLFEPSLDVAVLRVDEYVAPPLPLYGEGSDAVVGAVVGYPRGGVLASHGVVIRRIRTRLSDVYGSPGRPKEMLELEPPGMPGNSGGPVIDTEGRVIGVLTHGDGSASYAVAATELASLVEAIPSRPPPVAPGPCP